MTAMLRRSRWQARHSRQRPWTVTRLAPALVLALLAAAVPAWASIRAATMTPALTSAAGSGHDRASAPAGASPDILSPSSAGMARPEPATAVAHPAQGTPDGINAGFARLTGTLRVRSAGLAYAPLGDGLPTLLGEWEAGPAWSTMKVPLGIAALDRSDSASVRQLVHRAITESDNQAAEALWSQLGGGRTAADAVDAVLATHGDDRTHTQSQRIRPPYTPFGQTVWSLTDQVRFASALACSSQDQPVVDEMTHVVSAQQWGLGRLPSATFKGGWGPDHAGRYLVRQVGLISLNGHPVAVALAAEPTSGSFDDGVQALNRMTDWIRQSIHPATGGCR